MFWGEGNLLLAERLHPPLVPPLPQRKGCSHSLLSLQLISKSEPAHPWELVVPLISLLLGHADMLHWYQFQHDVGDCGEKGERTDQTESDFKKIKREKKKETLFDEAEKHNGESTG